MTTGKETPPKRRPTATTKLLLVTAATFLLTVFSPPPSKPTYHSLFLSLADNDTAASHLLALTRLPHGAGSAANSAAASYVSATLSSLSFPAHTTPYDVLLSYPSHRSLSLSRTSSSTPTPFDLVQEVYPGDPFVAAAASALPTFLAYTSSGTVVGPAVFAGFGRIEDFSVLESLGVNLSGAVVVARYGKIFRGDIIRHAREAGAAAAVIYTDASDYGGAYGGEERWFPDGKWMPPSGVQVGTTYRGSGDPTTPGWASKKGCERVGMKEIEESGMVPGIPALPVSARDGEAILQAIGGPVAPEEWQARKEAPVYHIGPGPGLLNLSYIVSVILDCLEM